MKIRILLSCCLIIILSGCKEDKKSTTVSSGKKLEKTEAEVKATLALRQKLKGFKEINFEGLECYETSKDKATCSFKKLLISVPHSFNLGVSKKDNSITNLYVPLMKGPETYNGGDKVLFSGSFSLKYQKPTFENKEGAPKLFAINLKIENQQKAP